MNRTTRTIVALALAVLLGTAAAATFATPVSAQSVTSCSSTWKRDGWTSTKLYIRNDCNKPIRVKFDRFLGTDSGCIYLKPGYTAVFTTGFFGSARFTARAC